MEQFLCQLTPIRTDMLAQGPTPQEAAAIDAHFHYLSELSEQGSVLMAGRTLVADERAQGLVILKAANEAQARALMLADPVVSEAVMRMELLPFRVALWSEQLP
ncbi:YciI family protein [Ferrimonas kyonanensis]|uniref:YciI family protein n=1 Tax=Ferrimonas kyonanensis TaxID=364763 RepID=UPI0004202506|nr:YciI family protein [Ferrimonas kyonanensis]